MKRENGFTLVEMLLVLAILGVLASVAIMSVMRSRSAANESSAVGNMRTITSAQIAYSATCGMGGFSGALPTLGVPPPGSTEGFLPPDMTAAPVVRRSGYQIRVAPSAASLMSSPDCNGNVTETGFYASSEPLTYGTSGSRSFATATPHTTIWQAYSAVAPAEPFAAPATPLQ